MYDIIIIGSGSAGLTAAIYGIRAGKKVLVIEKEYEGTGQIALSSKVDNYPGYYNIDGYTLGEHFREHALSLGAEIKNGTVLSIRKVCSNKISDTGISGSGIEADGLGEVFEVAVKVRRNEILYRAADIVYCAGAHHRMLNVDGEERLQGKGVSYCATCDGSFFKGMAVAVVGGGDTALDDALYLSDIAKHVTLIHRRDSFRGAYTTLEKLRGRENVTIITGVNVKAVAGKDKVEKLVLDNDNEIDVDGVFIAVGMVPESGLVKGLAECDAAGYVKAGEDGRTDCKGLYVAGDVRTKELRQIITAAADGANVINSIIQDDR